MNISMFIGSIYGGGAERVICNLANHLIRRGHNVEILTMSETPKQYELDRDVSVFHLLPLNERKNKLYNDLIRVHRLRQYMKSHKDIHVYIVFLPATSIMLLTFKNLTKAKIISSERADPALYLPVMGKTLRLLAKRADGFVFQTEDAKTWYGDSVKDIHTAIIPNPISPNFIRPKYEGERRKVIAGVGRLTDQKNFSLLIRAFSRIASDIPDYNLVIYGEGNKRAELERLIESLGMQKRISLPGNIQNIADEMQKNSLFVLSSNSEGMPNVLMEAMALGLPCISTDCPCGGPRFLIQDGVNGVLVPVGDEVRMAEVMKKVITDTDFREKIADNAMNIQKKLAPENIYSQWDSLIEKVCGN